MKGNTVFKLSAILARLREPSTMAGLSMLGVLVGLPPGSVELTLQMAAAGAAVLAIALPESKPAAAPAADPVREDFAP